MTNFSFTNPSAPIKSNEKKETVWSKIWAGLNLISLLGDMLMPKGTKDNVPIKVRNIIILVFVAILGYFIGCGIYINAIWIIHQVEKISFSLGDGFYYFGLVSILFLAMDFFKLEDKLNDHALQKKIISSAVKNMGKEKNVLKDVSKEINSKLKYLSVLSSAVSILSLAWVIWGIIFYERILFSSLIVLSVLFSIATAPVKNVKHLKIIFIAEILVNILVVAAILINHFIF